MRKDSHRLWRLRRWVGLVGLLVLNACSYPGPPQAAQQEEITQPPPSSTPRPDANPTTTRIIAPSSTLSPTQTRTSTSTASATVTPAPTETATATQTATSTITPTYAIIRGKVLVQANCRYGPGAPYLYKYGVSPPTVLEIFGRNDAGTWVLVRAIGGTNACWVKADLLELRGDVMSVAPTYTELPRSPYYDAMGAVSASREGDEVTVRWGGIVLRPGDDSLQTPYVVEAWVCQQGEFIFIPVGAYGFSTVIVDEKGCRETSHARVTAAEKHGYTPWVEVPWPPQEDHP